jgi:hypothetical protein
MSLMVHRSKRIDPEPFGIAVGVAGIVGGLAGAVSLYRDFSRTRFRRSHRAALATLKNVIETLAAIDQDLADMENLVAHSLSTDLQPIWLGSRVLMVPAQFADYARKAEGLLPKLRKVLKATHRLEGLAVSLPYVQSQTNRNLVDLNLKIEAVLAGRHRPPTEILSEVGEIVKQSRSVVEELFVELGGEQSREDSGNMI